MTRRDPSRRFKQICSVDKSHLMLYCGDWRMVCAVRAQVWPCLTAIARRRQPPASSPSPFAAGLRQDRRAVTRRIQAPQAIQSAATVIVQPVSSFLAEMPSEARRRRPFRVSGLLRGCGATLTTQFRPRRGLHRRRSRRSSLRRSNRTRSKSRLGRARLVGHPSLALTLWCSLRMPRPPRRCRLCTRSRVRDRARRPELGRMQVTGQQQLWRLIAESWPPAPRLRTTLEDVL